jgi:hypothetical protein
LQCPWVFGFWGVWFEIFYLVIFWFQSRHAPQPRISRCRWSPPPPPPSFPGSSLISVLPFPVPQLPTCLFWRARKMPAALAWGQRVVIASPPLMSKKQKGAAAAATGKYFPFYNRTRVISPLFSMMYVTGRKRGVVCPNEGKSN